ncbi:hypothetical protein H6792_01500 [Candidatus Nomurabacteria bacterium]|nr:hypothetical protein [Candidatus Nomurabacteria bacterium]
MKNDIGPELTKSESVKKNRLAVGPLGTKLLLVILAISFLIFVIFLWVGLGFGGPAYLTDEIGYLVKAAALAGSKIDSTSAWHSGYSFFIAPFFVIFDNPLRVWKGVALINAMFWAASYLLNVFVLRSIFPSKSDKQIILASLVAFLYPSWLSITGYAFPSSLFTFILMLTLILYLKSNLEFNRYLALALVLSGFLYWVHPIGIIFVFLSLIVVSFAGFTRKEKLFRWLLYLLVPIAVTLVYMLVIRPFITDLLSPSGIIEIDHYTRDKDRILQNLLTLEFYQEILIVLAGHLGYLLVSSFGVVSFLLVYLVSRLKAAGRSQKRIFSSLLNPELYIPIISLMGVIGVIILVSITSSGTSILRIDQWIYGRYLEMTLLPVIGISLLVPWQKNTAFMSATILLLIGIILNLFTNSHNTTPVINEVNIQSFWPFVIAGDGNYLDWFIFGAVGVALLGLLIWVNKRILILPIFILLAIASFNVQKDWHQSIISNYSYTTELYPMVTNHFAPDTTSCIGFDDSDHSIDPERGERLRLYSFYLKNYSLLKIDFQEWLDQCNGPYLTYSLDDLDFEQAQVVGREVPSGLYFVVKKSSLDQFVDYQELVPTSNFYFNLSDQDCVIQGCFDWYAREGGQAVGFPVTGEYYAGLLISKPSMLPTLYGPYTRVKQGEYLLSISARYLDFSSQQEVMQVSIVYDKGRKVSKSVEISKQEMLTESGEIKIPFSLDSDVEDLEVQIGVIDPRLIDRSIFALDSYKVEIRP